jgi:hypothetical protein
MTAAENKPDLKAYARGLIHWQKGDRAAARSYALHRADSLRRHGDLDGHDAWLSIAEAVQSVA